MSEPQPPRLSVHRTGPCPDPREDPRAFADFCEPQIQEFATWYGERIHPGQGQGPIPLINIEKGILIAFLSYLCSKEEP